jgi:hypothetical protein
MICTRSLEKSIHIPGNPVFRIVAQSKATKENKRRDIRKEEMTRKKERKRKMEGRKRERV